MPDTVVVYVHGLWFTGWEALLLRSRLARALGAAERVFSYRSVLETIDTNVAALGQFLATIRCDTLHLVGHSLGGVMLVRLFRAPLQLPPGRILLLGSPLRGSQAARSLSHLPFGATLLGRSMQDLIEPAGLRWPGDRDLGIIAGDAGFGLGQLVNRFHAPHDGTVLVEETQLEGATDHLVLPVTHSGFLVSPEVVRQGAAFLRDGHFAR